MDESSSARDGKDGRLPTPPFPRPDSLTDMEWRESYAHGRAQGRLTIARDALKSILARTANRKTALSLEIAAAARFALEQSKPPEES